jgi:hypothetical protein
MLKIGLPFILHWCETCSVILRDEHMLQVLMEGVQLQVLKMHRKARSKLGSWGTEFQRLHTLMYTCHVVLLRQ